MKTGRLLALGVLLPLACRGAPAREPSPGASGRDRPPGPPPALADPCAGVAGSEAPARAFEGLLRGARCQAEVMQIMTDTARALGVSCDHCHERGDFARATPMKEVANWMSTKLVPSLRKRGGGAVGCADCHASGGAGVAKILGSPRRQDRSVEWMTTVLSERFETVAGGPLYCRTCHVGNVGQPGFEKKVILTDRLPEHPAAALGTDG